MISSENPLAYTFYDSHFPGSIYSCSSKFLLLIFPDDATCFSLLCVTAELIRQNFATYEKSTYKIVPFVKMSSTINSTINFILFVHDIEF